MDKPTFKYRCVGANWQIACGDIEATNRFSALTMLEQAGMTPLELTECSRSAAPEPKAETAPRRQWAGAIGALNAALARTIRSLSGAAPDHSPRGN
ncbi:MAG: hypothetical protein BWZ10_00095 [candidate division BRC1 bacterium ADurb.BinA364]|nr:MAG: hypothetical protein BWZ10_00095 [candidate division BRC1 bacterium ADurb.BinA364]